MNSSIQSLNISWRGSHGPYDAGSYKATHEDLSKYFREGGREKEPIFHFVFGTSIGSINAAILASYVKENRAWEGSGQRLEDFWEYLSTSTKSSVDKIPHFTELGFMT